MWMALYHLDMLRSCCRPLHVHMLSKAFEDCNSCQHLLSFNSNQTTVVYKMCNLCVCVRMCECVFECVCICVGLCACLWGWEGWVLLIFFSWFYLLFLFSVVIFNLCKALLYEKRQCRLLIKVCLCINAECSTSASQWILQRRNFHTSSN